MIRLAFAFLLALCVSAQAQLSGGVGGFPGPGTAHSVATYTGPGDVFTTSPYAWYSCSRGFTAAYAAPGTGGACDVVDTATGLVTCTYHVGTNGFVNPSECNGVGQSCQTACRVTKAYDQTGNARDVVQTTLAAMPGLTFSSTPTGTLPAIDCNIGTNPVLATTATYTQAQPLTLSAVYIRTTGTALGGTIGANANVIVGAGSGANLAVAASGGAGFTVAATDNTWHAINALLNGTGTSSAINLDGADTTGSSGGTTGFITNNIRVCRAAASPLAGRIAEAGIWAASTNATDRGNINTNQHGTSGYNF